LLRRTEFLFSLIIVVIMAMVSFCSPALAQSGRTFYIDYASGSNGNPGSKASPWKTHPYMQTGAACTGSGSAPSYSHQAGDKFIFKGGVTWPAACLGLHIPTGGSSASVVDYYGVDKGWFAGAQWAMPIFDAQKTIPATTSFFLVDAGQGYIVFDGFELKNQRTNNSGSDCYGGNSDAAYNLYQTKNVTVENGYIHDWVSTQQSNIIYNDGTGGICSAALADHMVIHDAGGTPAPFGGCFRNVTEIRFSVCHDVGQGANGFVSVHDSEFYNITAITQSAPFAPGVHTNTVQDTWQGSVSYVYNNYFHDNTTGEHLTVNPDAFVFNNISMNESNGAGLIGIDPGIDVSTNYPSSVARIYNNSFDCTHFPQCVGVGRAGFTIGQVYIDNNHFLTNSNTAVYTLNGTANINVGSHNVKMSPVAALQAFATSIPLQPTSSSSPTVGQGVNESSLCTGNLAPLCSSTSAGNHITPAPRPSGSAWDAGGYQFSGQSSSQPSKPNPPTALAAQVQ
jgi:hypothetical protein